MFLSISLPKHGGDERSKSFDNSLKQPDPVRKAVKTLLLLSFVVCISMPTVKPAGGSKTSSAEAISFHSKQKMLEEHAAGTRPLPKSQTIKFTQDELNSYLALDLKPQYHACLKNLVIAFEEGKLQGVADIDFDRLEASSSKLGSKLLSLLFSGTRTLSVRGKLISKNGKAFFQLEQATFDGSTLPKPLVETIISLVGRRQNPPLDPLKPSNLPYGIDHVGIHRGYALVYP